MENNSKRQTQNDVVSIVKWETLNPDILSLIFLKISSSADQIVKAVSLVCKGWLEVVVGPYCWAEVDVDSWCRSTERRDMIDSVVRKLVRRSRCTVKSVKGYRLGNVGFAYVAACGRFLTVLQIPLSDITDDMVEQHAGSLVNLKELDISCCLKMTHKSLSYFGKSCQSLTNLRRNLVPQRLTTINEVSFPEIDDNEAYAIAITMRGLCHLELANGCFSERGLDEILTNCKLLTYLDIEGCENVSLDGDLKEQCERLLVFRSPGSHFAEESTESESSSSDYDEEEESESSSSDYDEG